MPVNTDDLTIPTAPAEGDYEDQIEVKTTAVGDGIAGVIAMRKQVETKFGDKIVLEFAEVTAVCSGGVDAVGDPTKRYTLWPTPGALKALDDVGATISDRVVLGLAELKDTGKGNPYKIFGAKVVEKGNGTPPPRPVAEAAAAPAGNPFG